MIEAASTHDNFTCSKFSFGITKEEVLFILNFPDINKKHKYVWLALVLLNATYPDFSKEITFQFFAKFLGISKFNLSQALEHLEVMGFIEY